MTENLFTLLTTFIGLLLLWCIIIEIHVIVINVIIDDCLQRVENLENEIRHQKEVIT